MKKLFWKVFLFFILIFFVIVLGNKIRLNILSTDKMTDCLRSSYFNSNNTCFLSERSMYFELLTREENDEIAKLFSQMHYAASNNKNSTSLSQGLVLLEDKANASVPLLESYIQEKIHSEEDIAKNVYLQYELFVLGMIGEDASCAMNTIMEIAETGKKYDNGSFLAEENLAYWTVEQLLGDRRTFDLPSDIYESEYDDWFSCTIPYIGDRNQCDNYDDLRVESMTGLLWIGSTVTQRIKNQYSIRYYTVHLPEDNQVIQKWWETEGQYIDWGICEP